ncbi:MAG: PIN domain-containing protein [Hormoscilla sp.]
MFLIYLDICCLNRPFDDLSQERVSLEAQAVELIIDRCRNAQWHLLGSTAIDIELARTPTVERKQQMMLWAGLAKNKVTLSDDIITRTQELAGLGFKYFDALHIACAENGNADVLLTTDDRMLRLAVRSSAMLKVRVENPARWSEEVINDRSNDRS